MLHSLLTTELHYDYDSFSTLLTDSPLSPGYRVLAIAGPQSSGKSTLMNAIFAPDPRLPEMDAARGRQQTTRGAHVFVHTADNLLVIDGEGCDSAERAADENGIGDAQMTYFMAVCSSLLLFNINHLAMGQAAASGRGLIKYLLEARNRTTEAFRVMIIVRDVDFGAGKEAFDSDCERFRADVARMWGNISTEPFDEVIELDFYGLHHYRYEKASFDDDVTTLRTKLLQKLHLLPEYPLPCHDLLDLFQTYWRHAEGLASLDQMAQIRQMAAVRLAAATEVAVHIIDANTARTVPAAAAAAENVLLHTKQRAEEKFLAVLREHVGTDLSLVSREEAAEAVKLAVNVAAKKLQDEIMHNMIEIEHIYTEFSAGAAAAAEAAAAVALNIYGSQAPADAEKARKLISDSVDTAKCALQRAISDLVSTLPQWTLPDLPLKLDNPLLIPAKTAMDAARAARFGNLDLQSSSLPLEMTGLTTLTPAALSTLVWRMTPLAVAAADARKIAETSLQTVQLFVIHAVLEAVHVSALASGEGVPTFTPVEFKVPETTRRDLARLYAVRGAAAVLANLPELTAPALAPASALAADLVDRALAALATACDTLHCPANDQEFRAELAFQLTGGVGFAFRETRSFLCQGGAIAKTVPPRSPATKPFPAPLVCKPCTSLRQPLDRKAMTQLPAETCAELVEEGARRAIGILGELGCGIQNQEDVLHEARKAGEYVGAKGLLARVLALEPWKYAAVAGSVAVAFVSIAVISI